MRQPKGQAPSCPEATSDEVKQLRAKAGQLKKALRVLAACSAWTSLACISRERDY
jgi:hypothetical protein